MERLSPNAPDPILMDRARRTLAIAHRWGYAPTVEALAADLVGGPTSSAAIHDAIRDAEGIAVRDGFACLAGFEELVEKSKRRVATHRAHNGGARAVARMYAEELVRSCPIVECVALSGSAASGGYDARDDVDFDLFVIDDAKYVVYALALLLSAKASLRHRRSLGLRKIICINVVWTRAESMPFQRRDEDLAFELLRCRPLIGAAHFAQVLESNRWVRRHFPQLVSKSAAGERVPTPNVVGFVVGWIARHPRLLRAANEFSRVAAHTVYSSAHLLKRRDREARARLAYLQRVKFPYEVFQD